MPNDSPKPGAFAWVDRAACNAAVAERFYGQAFGWSFVDQHANGGFFTRCRIGAQDVGSLYQLPRAQLGRGVPSHWTPYISVEDVDDTARRITTLGCRLIVAPFDVEATARIALIEDAVGALVGLWQPLAPPHSRSHAR